VLDNLRRGPLSLAAGRRPFLRVDGASSCDELLDRRPIVGDRRFSSVMARDRVRRGCCSPRPWLQWL
jgi:hypothetical protein